MSSHKRSRKSSAKNTTRPRLEMLEDRLAPALFSVSNGSSLAAAIAASGSNDDTQNVIDLAPGTYSVTGQVIKVASTKTLAIIGPDQGATLQADGSNRVLEINANVVLQNLLITGGD